jgi:hypothetical protein
LKWAVAAGWAAGCVAGCVAEASAVGAGTSGADVGVDTAGDDCCVAGGAEGTVTGAAVGVGVIRRPQARLLNINNMRIPDTLKDESFIMPPFTCMVIIGKLVGKSSLVIRRIIF